MLDDNGNFVFKPRPMTAARIVRHIVDCLKIPGCEVVLHIKRGGHVEMETAHVIGTRGRFVHFQTETQSFLALPEEIELSLPL
jgi:hypothetical protein